VVTEEKHMSPLARKSSETLFTLALNDRRFNTR
jgi:hypothetical protein